MVGAEPMVRGAQPTVRCAQPMVGAQQATPPSTCAAANAVPQAQKTLPPGKDEPTLTQVGARSQFHSFRFNGNESLNPRAILSSLLFSIGPSQNNQEQGYTTSIEKPRI